MITFLIRKIFHFMLLTLLSTALILFAIIGKSNPRYKTLIAVEKWRSHKFTNHNSACVEALEYNACVGDLNYIKVKEIGCIFRFGKLHSKSWKKQKTYPCCIWWYNLCVVTTFKRYNAQVKPSEQGFRQ